MSEGIPEPNTRPPEGDQLRPLPPIRTAAEIVKNPAPKRPEIIKGLLKRCSKLAIGGASKSRKTWLLMNLGLAVATGQSWLIFDTEPTKVLYVNFELHDDAFEDRLGIICNGMETTLSELGDKFAHWGLRSYAAPYDTILPLIAKHIKESGYGLIIIDPTYKVLGNLKENEAGDMTKLMNEIERVASETKAAIVTANHFAKGNKANAQDGDRISGSGVFQRDPDSLLEFVDHAESDDTNDILSVRSRLREHKPVKPFTVKWDGVSLFEVSNHDPRKLKKAGGRPTDFSAEDLLKALTGEMTSGEWQKKAAEEYGIKGKTFYRLKNELVEAGKVKKDGGKYSKAEDPENVSKPL